MKKLLFCALLAMAFAQPALAQDKPAPAPEKPAATGPAPTPGTEPDPKIFQEMYNCIAEGLKPGWKRAWITVVELDRSDDGNSRNFEAVFLQTDKDGDKEGEALPGTCGSGRILKNIGDLNEYLLPEQRRWTEVTITFYSEGKYEVKYGFGPIRSSKPAAKPGAKPAAKPPAKKPEAKKAETK
jgi:hypothetical protein